VARPRTAWAGGNGLWRSGCTFHTFGPAFPRSRQCVTPLQRSGLTHRARHGRPSAEALPRTSRTAPQPGTAGCGWGRPASRIARRFTYRGTIRGAAAAVVESPEGPVRITPVARAVAGCFWSDILARALSTAAEGTRSAGGHTRRGDGHAIHRYGHREPRVHRPQGCRSLAQCDHAPLAV
jgi:hypothetical protein